MKKLIFEKHQIKLLKEFMDDTSSNQPTTTTVSTGSTDSTTNTAVNNKPTKIATVDNRKGINGIVNAAQQSQNKSGGATQFEFDSGDMTKNIGSAPKQVLNVAAKTAADGANFIRNFVNGTGGNTSQSKAFSNAINKGLGTAKVTINPNEQEPVGTMTTETINFRKDELDKFLQNL